MSYVSELRNKRAILVKQIEAIDLLLSEGQTSISFDSTEALPGSGFRPKSDEDNWLEYVKDALKHLGGNAHTKKILDLVEKSNPSMDRKTARRQTSVMLSKHSKENDEQAFIQHKKEGSAPKKGANYELIEK